MINQSNDCFPARFYKNGILQRNESEGWLRNLSSIQDELMALCHLTEGVPGRGTEKEELIIKNSPYYQRSVLFSQGFCFPFIFFSRWKKSKTKIRTKI